MLIKAKILFLFLFGFSITNSQTLNYYFGNLHSHSGYSDGSKDSVSTGVSKPSGGYSFAKLSQHFDFLGISEHNHYSSNNNPGMVRTSYGLGLAEAAAANTGTFLCLYGMEYGVSSTNNGHVVIYGFNQLIGWETTGVPNSVPNYDIYNGKTRYDSLWRLVKNNPNAFATLAHPNYSDYNSLASSAVNPAWDSAIVGVPFRNGLALTPTANYTDYPTSDYFAYYRILLNRGYHIGMSYDHDNHYLNFGRGNAGRLVVVIPSLTQTNLFTAMKAMHFYGSDDWNAKVDFKIGTHIMGDTMSGNAYPVINVVHNDGDGEMADSIKIWSGVSGSWQDPTIVAMVKQSNTLVYTNNTVTAGNQHYFLVEIVQADGDRIITSPIWFKGLSPIRVKENKKEFSFLMFPNPVNSKLNISTGICDDYKIEIIDITGKKFFEQNYNEPNVTISTSSFEQGFYFLTVKYAGFVKTERLIIE
jgi:hypothetical protein